MWYKKKPWKATKLSKSYLGGVGPHKTTKQFLNIDPWLNGLKFSWPLLAEKDPLIWKINIIIISNILFFF